MNTLAKEGFRAAPTHEERVHEAAKLFGRGKSGADHFAQATLLEAFSTSDFPVLLGDAFAKSAIKAQKDAVKEFEPLLVDITVDDFKRRKLVDLWTGDAFEPVGQGEEYKGGTLQETELDHGAAKHGKSYGLTWELRRSREFSYYSLIIIVKQPKIKPPLLETGPWCIYASALTSDRSKSRFILKVRRSSG